MDAVYYIVIFLLSSFVIFSIAWISYYLNRLVLNRVPISLKISFINIFASIIFSVSIAFYFYNIDDGISYIEIIILIIASILFFFIVYFLNYLALKPLKKIEYTAFQIANNFYKIDNKMKGNYQFVEIQSNLQKIKENSLDTMNKMQKLKKVYNKYIPKQFVKYLGKHELFELTLGDSVQKEVSILFIDIRNSLMQSQSMSLSDNFGIINDYLGHTSEIIRQCNGFVDKYLGDGILAVFIKPDNALKASIKIVKEFESLKKNKGYESFNIGLAIHSGKVVIGVVGEKERLSTTIISDTVNMASRLEGFNKLFQTKIVFTKQFLNALTNSFPLYYRYLGNYTIPSSNEKISIFECLNYMYYKNRNEMLLYKNQFESIIRSIETHNYTVGIEKLKKLLNEHSKDIVLKNVVKLQIDKEK